MVYTSLEQRVAASYLDEFPSFVPAEHAEVNLNEQQRFYDLMKKLYQLLFDHPLLIVPTLHEDDAFPSRYKTSYGNPDLQVNVSKCKRAINHLLQNMFLIGQGLAVKLNKRHQKILSMLGVDDFTQLPPAWTWMSNRLGADQVAFAYCLFDKDHVYSVDVYARLLGEEAFRKLEKWLISKGYQPYDIYNKDYADYRLTLTYANPAWGKEQPNTGFEYKIKHTGISVQYDAGIKNPVVLGVCIPYGMKFFLNRFNLMEKQVKDFCIQHTKKCDRCRYCVQTDKTGARPLAYIPVFYEGTDYKLCPYFPGYTYSWTSIDSALVENITDFLTFMDGFSTEKIR